MEIPMPSPKNARVAKRAAASPASESGPAGANAIALDANGGRILETVVRLGRRKWRLFYVSAEEIWQGVTDMSEPGWYVSAVNPSPHWVNCAPLGPYATVEELREDAFDALRETP
jgi:hypothetical protein